MFHMSDSLQSDGTLAMQEYSPSLPQAPLPTHQARMLTSGI